VIPAKTTKKVVTYCDFCDNKSADHYGNERKCMVCGRDICRNHQTYDPDEPGDYGGYYCPVCIRLYNEKWQKLLYQLHELQYEAEQNFFKEMKRESLSENS
jgi:hypothetical protein